MDALTTIKYPILEEFEHFRTLFYDALKSDDDLLGRVLDHVSSRSGKMMRPVLTLLLAKSLGPVNDNAYYGALSLELLHNASLVHDDVVDESQKRRGLPSVHAIFDNKIAVLVGDYLLASSLKASSQSTLEIVNIISLLGMALSKGEILQISTIETVSFSEEVYFNVIKDKTASLFAACGSIAALSCGAPAQVVEKYRQFGEKTGLIFQIRDDIFDYQSNIEIGKPTSNDMREGKLTLPAIYALNTYQDETMRELALRIRSLQASDEEISAFTAWVIAHEGITYAEQKMEQLCKEALLLIQDMDDVSTQSALETYLYLCKDRSK